MVTEDEVRAVLEDLSWLDRCICGQWPIEAYFVDAGRAIAHEVLETARSCPSRRQEVIHAYARRIKHGYFGGFSPAERAKMTLEEALAKVEADDRERLTALEETYR